MANSYVSVGAMNASSGTTSRNAQVPTPSLVSPGDLLLAVLVKKNNGTNVTVSGTDWKPYGSVIVNGQLSMAIAWKVSAGVDPDACTFTWTGSCAAAVQCTNWRGTQLLPLSTNVGSIGSGTTTAHSAPSIQTTENNSFAIYIDVAAANTALATPTGWTEDSDAGSATSATRTTWGHKLMANPGATGIISATGANASWIMKVIEVLVLETNFFLMF